MRIEIVTDTYHPDVNGVAMTLGRLVKGIKEKGHEVHVMHTALGDAAEEETQMRGVSLPGYHEVRVGLPKPLKFKRKWISSWSSWWPLPIKFRSHAKTSNFCGTPCR